MVTLTFYPELTTRRSVRQGCPLFTFLFNSMFKMITEMALFPYENNGIGIPPDKKSSDLEHTDHLVLLNEHASKLQVPSRPSER